MFCDLRLAAQSLERVLAAEAELLLDRAALQLVVVCREGGGERVGEAVDDLRHAVGEGFRRAGRQLQRAKAAGRRRTS